MRPTSHISTVTQFSSLLLLCLPAPTEPVDNPANGALGSPEPLVDPAVFEALKADVMAAMEAPDDAIVEEALKLARENKIYDLGDLTTAFPELADQIAGAGENRDSAPPGTQVPRHYADYMHALLCSWCTSGAMPAHLLQ